MDLSKIKISYLCRNINIEKLNDDPLFLEKYIPHAGDVGIFKVISIGKHKKVENYQSINQYLMENDWVMCAFGNRYASAQFEGYVPEILLSEYDLLGQGGVVGELHSMHNRYERIGPTKLTLIGLATDQQGNILNTHATLPNESTLSVSKHANYKVILSIGSSMDSGKTTTAAYTIHGLSKAGYRVSFIKLTGTAYTKDVQFARDLGAISSVDFSYFGYPSTYMYPVSQLIHLFKALLAESSRNDPDFIVVEIADGILQRETFGLLSNENFMDMIHNVILSAVDSLGLLGALHILDRLNIAPTLLAGRATSSPLLIREIQDLCSIPVMELSQLQDPEHIIQYLGKYPSANNRLQRNNIAA